MGLALRVLVVAGLVAGNTAGDTGGGILTMNVLTLDRTRVARNTPDNCVC